jgi:hypothetical protein
VKEKLYPVTFSNLFYTVLVFLMGGAVTEYLCGYTLFRWIYLGFGAVIPVSTNKESVEECHKTDFLAYGYG